MQRLSIRTKVVVLIVAVVSLLQVFSLVINYGYLKLNAVRSARDGAPTFFRFALPAVLGAPVEMRDTIAGSFRTPLRVMTITDAPSLAPDLGDVLEPHRADMSGEFLRGAGLPVAEALAGWREIEAPARAAGLSSRPMRGVLEVGRGGFVSALSLRRDQLPRWAIPGGGAPLPEGTASQVRTAYVLSLRLEGDPTWYNYTTLQVARTPWGPLLLPALALVPVALLLVGLSLLVLGRITRPLRDITATADKLGRGEYTGDIPEEGSSDVLPTIRAFNTMSHRINQAIDYQVSLVRSLGHDIRGPLATMAATLDRIEPPHIRSQFASSLARATRITEAILHYTRATMRDGEVVRVDLGTLLESLAEEFSDDGRVVAIDVAETLPVPGRYNALERAMRNLMENAVRYVGSVEVSLAREDRMALVRIQDRGPGIPPEQLDAVFDPFQRVAEGGEGAGLGLAIVKSIITDHGGTVALRNREGGGLSATVALPLS